MNPFEGTFYNRPVCEWGDPPLDPHRLLETAKHLKWRMEMTDAWHGIALMYTVEHRGAEQERARIAGLCRAQTWAGVDTCNPLTAYHDVAARLSDGGKWAKSK